jgi:lipoprotein-anchoring transpeptidase ErfK/SrfK
VIHVRLVTRTLLVGAALLLLASCGGGRGQGTPTPGPPEPAPAAASPAEPTSPSGDRLPLATGSSTVARTDAELAVFASPEASSPTAVLPATTEFGSARALLVVDRRPGWVHVALPTRPNGSTGWVREAEVELRSVDEAIHVDLAARQLTLVVAGEVVLQAPVAIGTPDAPTPTGTFFVVDKLATPDGDGAYGPFALGLSGHSEVLTEFGGGDGQVGLHGTDDPTSIGQAASHGCVRVPNDVITALDELVPLGTPVTIR